MHALRAWKRDGEWGRLYFFARISKDSLVFAHVKEGKGCWWVWVVKKFCIELEGWYSTHVWHTYRDRGVGLKDFFLFQHTNRDCFVFLRLFTFTFAAFSLSFVLCSIFFAFFLGRVFQFSRVFGDFTLTLSLSSSCMFFFLVKIGCLSSSSGGLESICHPAPLRSARFHEGSSTVLASVAA